MVLVFKIVEIIDVERQRVFPSLRFMLMVLEG